MDFLLLFHEESKLVKRLFVYFQENKSYPFKKCMKELRK
jgi:hypothetical protein